MKILQVVFDGMGDDVVALLATKLIIDLLAILVLVRFIYLKNYRRTDLFLTFFSFNIIVFFISYLLNRVEMSTGAAFGLFAIFSMLRYRTEGISAKDMTYLFLCIAIGLITAVSNGSILELFLIIVFIVAVIFLLESGHILRNRPSIQIDFDRTDLIHPDKRQELKSELEKRTGLSISHIEISTIDYLKDSAIVHIYYDQK
jgi:hypothetical protein